MNVTNIADFSQVTDQGYQVCGALSDYLINSFMDPLYEWEFFKNHFMRFNISIAAVNTNLIDIGLITENGWKKGVSSQFYFTLIKYYFLFRKSSSMAGM